MTDVKIRSGRAGPYREAQGPGGGTVGGQRYTVGPAGTGSEFATVQAAVDAAAAAGGAAEFFLYPVFYAEAVVVPDTLTRCYFVGAGGQVGTFLSSLTILRTDAVEEPFFSLENIGLSALTVLGSGTGGAEMRASAVFGLTTIDAAGLSLRVWDSQFIRTGQLIDFVGVRLDLSGCNVQSGDGATAAIVSEATILDIKQCEIFGTVVALGDNLTMNGNEIFFDTEGVLDGCDSNSEIFGNAFNALISSQDVYVKTGSSDLEEGGNSFNFLCVAPFFDVQAGSYRGGRLSAREVRARTSLALGGAAESLVLDQTTATSRAVDRRLAWNGTRNTYVAAGQSMLVGKFEVDVIAGATLGLTDIAGTQLTESLNRVQVGGPAIVLVHWEGQVAVNNDPTAFNILSTTEGTVQGPIELPAPVNFFYGSAAFFVAADPDEEVWLVANRQGTLSITNGKLTVVKIPL